MTMALKGAQFKQEVMKGILMAFPNSFLYNDGKEIRIDGTEAGERVQIKVTLTTSKTPVDNEDGTIVLTSEETPIKVDFENPPELRTLVPNEKVPDEPTEEEKARLKKLLEGLGL